MNGILLLADGFEDSEGLSTRDVLIRSGLNIVTASISSTRQVNSSFGISLFADCLISQINPQDFDFIILPGGGKGTRNLASSKAVESLILDFYHLDKLLCAICAAPSIYGKLGLLKDKKYTCFAGFNKGVEGNFTGEEVEVDENLITARSMMYSIPFALAIIEKLLGKEAKDHVMVGLMGKEEK